MGEKPNERRCPRCHNAGLRLKDFVVEKVDTCLGCGGMFFEQGELENLKSLNLSFNYFSGEIPLSLMQNENIEILYLHVNQLSGNISNDICKGKETIKLLIYGNSFCPPFPDCIKYIGKQTCEN